MLTAKMENSSLISLAEGYSRDYLEQLRKKQTFYCPECSRKVILKIGGNRIHHFAHEKGQPCLENYDRESEYHLLGKLKLYHWLKDQDVEPLLEPYFPSIKQRADIAFTYQNKTYCIEFQCSPIPAEVFVSRTKKYLGDSFVPIWILAGKQLKRKGSNLYSLSNFEFLFLTRNYTNQWYIPSYCPKTNLFLSLQSIFPTSSRNVYTKIFYTTLQKLKLKDFLHPTCSGPYFIKDWKEEIEKQKRKMIAFYKGKQQYYLKELYKNSMNLQLLPPYIGIPLKNNPLIETPPIIWQSYLFADYIWHLRKGELIFYQKVSFVFLKRVRANQIKLRVLPMVGDASPLDAVKEYLSLLIELGILSNKKESIYMLNVTMSLFKTMEEQINGTDDFYEKNGDIMMNHFKKISDSNQ